MVNIQVIDKDWVIELKLLIEASHFKTHIQGDDAKYLVIWYDNTNRTGEIIDKNFYERMRIIHFQLKKHLKEKGFKITRINSIYRDNGEDVMTTFYTNIPESYMITSTEDYNNIHNIIEEEYIE